MADSQLASQPREAVRRRASSCCEYCLSQERFSPDSFSVEHILPRSRGGTSELNNLAFACQGCNNRKHIYTEARDLVTGDVVPLYNPRQHTWGDHFAWSEGFSHIMGLTPTGRATVERLQLNRVGLVNLRHILRRVEEHPPTR